MLCSVAPPPTGRERCFHVSHRRVFTGCLAAECCPVREYLNHVVQEILMGRPVDSFQPLPHFQFFMAHFTDSMPISSIGGIWSVDLWNPRYA